MTIYGFFATIIICATVLGGIFLLAKYPLSFRIIRTTEAPKLVVPKEVPETVKVEVANNTTVTENKEEVKVVSMDAVIKAANELMGIQSTEEDK
jgi:hypothetical protein